MTPRDTRSAPRSPQAPATGGGRPHHLASVVHHFRSDEPASEPGSAAETDTAPVIVAGHGLPDPTSRVQEQLADQDLGRPILAAGGDRNVALTAAEGSTGFPGPGVAPGAVLVWCANAGTAGSLLAVRELGRWVRWVRPRGLEVLVLDGGGDESPPDLGRLRRRIDLVAPGLPTRLARVEDGRLKKTIPELISRLRSGSADGAG